MEKVERKEEDKASMLWSSPKEMYKHNYPTKWVNTTNVMRKLGRIGLEISVNWGYL